MRCMTAEPLTEHALQPDDDTPSSRETYAFVLTAFGLFGVLALVAAILIGTNKSDGAASTTSEMAMVTLSEFKIAPADITASAATGMHVTNNGNVQHNLAVEGTSIATPMIDAGGSAHLDLSSLSAGDYTVYLPDSRTQRSGHDRHVACDRWSAARQLAAPMAGMDMSSMSSMSPEQMDQAMKDSIAAFPAADRRSRRAGARADRARRTAPSSSSSPPPSPSGRCHRARPWTP